MNASPMDRREFIRSTSAGAALGGCAALSASAAGPARGKRIGFVDHLMDNYHSRVFLNAIRGPLKDRGYEVAGCHAVGGDGGREWAAKNKVKRFDSVAELNEAVDCFMILSPSNPELHLDMAKAVLPAGKSTYIDKTFAPDVATAREIFALADRHGTPVQTTSALRYTNVQKHVESEGRENLRHMVAWVAGSNYDEYVIHPLELIVSCMGHEVESVMRRGSDPETQLLLNFSGGRTGTVCVYNKTSTKYSASVTTRKRTVYLEADLKRIFVDNMAAIMDFFESGPPNIDRRESMALMRIMETARGPEAVKGFVKL